MIIYCIALEGEGPTGVNWYYNRTKRDLALGTTGADEEVAFEVRVDDNATYDQITKEADDAAWEKDWDRIDEEDKS